MIYYASRSHIKYLHALVEASLSSSPSHLVSITGGLVFLHSLSKHTLSLHLVDIDPEVNKYASVILNLIKVCPTRMDFFGVLFSYKLEPSVGVGARLSYQVFEEKEKFLSLLDDEEANILRFCYPSSLVEVELGKIVTKGYVIHLGMGSNEAVNFSWLCGFGCFQSESSYSSMRETLMALEVKLINMDLSQFPFEELDGDIVVLASNAEGPLFTNGDKILKRLKSSPLVNPKYISRTRDFFIEKEPVASCHEQLSFTRFPIFVSQGLEIQETLAEIIGAPAQTISYGTYILSNMYDEELIVFDLTTVPISKNAFLSSIEEEVPLHQRVAFLDLLDSENICFEQFLKGTYRLQKTEERANYRVVFYELIGRLPYAL